MLLTTNSWNNYISIHSHLSQGGWVTNDLMVGAWVIPVTLLFSNPLLYLPYLFHYILENSHPLSSLGSLMSNILEQKHMMTSFGALQKLNGWKSGVIKGSSELFSAKSHFKELIERLTMGCSIYSKIMHRHKRQKLVQRLNIWKFYALFEISKEQLQ